VCYENLCHHLGDGRGQPGDMIEGMPVEEALATVQLSRPQAKPYEDVVVVLRALAARRGNRT